MTSASSDAFIFASSLCRDTQGISLLKVGTGYLHGKNKGKKMLEFCCAIGEIPS